MLKNKGFSLIEVLLVIGIAAGIFLFAAPFSMNLYRTQLVEEARSNIIDALQRARHSAVLQKNDSQFGVSLSLTPNNYVLFQGASTSTRDEDQDEIFPVVDSITFSGLTDVVFSKLVGVPSATGTINLVYGSISRGILVEESGGISKTAAVSVEEGSDDSQIPTEGLVAYWSFDGNAEDSVGGNDGVVSGATPTTGVQGVADTAYSFDGDGDYVNLTNSNSLKPTAFSFSVWVNRIGSMSNLAGILSSPHNWQGGAGYILTYRSSDDKMVFYIAENDANDWKTIASGGIIPLNEWTHYTVTFSGTEMKMYVNGDLQSEALTINGIYYGDTTVSAAIGAYTYDGGGIYFNGSLDEVRFYNRVLTEEEIQIIYNEEAP